MKDTLARTGLVVLPVVASLINGVGQLPSAGCDDDASGPLCKYAYVKAVAAPCGSGPQARARMSKLRLMHQGSSWPYNVSVDQHRMIVVGADSTPTEPTEVRRKRGAGGARSRGRSDASGVRRARRRRGRAPPGRSLASQPLPHASKRPTIPSTTIKPNPRRSAAS